MPKTRNVKDAIKEVIVANDGDPDLQATVVLHAFAWIFDQLANDPEIIATHRKFLGEIAKGLREDANP